jgi:hypothetical protein
MSIAFVAACGGDTVSPAPNAYPVRFLVSNRLIAPITIAVDGAPYAFISSGNTTALTLSTAQSLVWTSAKPKDAAGTPIPDDIGEVKIEVAGINGTLEIGNVIGDQTYITARIFNDTSVPVSIGVFDGTSVSCASALPAGSANTTGFTQIGYYRLLPATEIRAYHDP